MKLVLLASSPADLQSALRVQEATGASVWCGSDALSEEEFSSLKDRGITRFGYPLGQEITEVLRGAAATIAEHHPGASIWLALTPE